MATCGGCDTTILFGGVRDGDQRFCNNDCHHRGYLLAVANQIPEGIVREQADRVYRGMCPKCQGPGPVDVHTSYRVWSAVLLTSWQNTPEISCRRCGAKAQVGNALFSLVLGWWGFPWGLLMTPVQITRNIVALSKSPQHSAASPELTRFVSMNLAGEVLKQEEATAPAT
jgi:hypothetical protein